PGERRALLRETARRARATRGDPGRSLVPVNRTGYPGLSSSRPPRRRPQHGIAWGIPPRVTTSNTKVGKRPHLDTDVHSASLPFNRSSLYSTRLEQRPASDYWTSRAARVTPLPQLPLAAALRRASIFRRKWWRSLARIVPDSSLSRAT